MYKDKICPVCGKSFAPRSARSKYCSDDCRKAFEQKKIAENKAKIVKTCEWCGKQFHPRTNTQRYCDDVHYANCVVCGKQYIINLRSQDKRKTCSKECHDKYKFHKGNPFSNTALREKAAITMVSRYGGDHPMHVPSIVEKQKATTKERYGTEYFAQSDKYMDKAIQTNRQRYGTDWPIQNTDIKNKQVETFNNKYNVDNAVFIPGVLDKIKQRNIENLGVSYTFQSPEIKAKSAQTCQKRYGQSHYSRTPEFARKYVNTMQERYGPDNPSKVEEFRQKRIETNKLRYGTGCYLASKQCRDRLHSVMQSKHNVFVHSQSEEWKVSRVKNPEKLDEWMSFLSNPTKYLDSKYNELPTLLNLSHDLGVSDTTVSYYINKLGLQNKVKYVLSHMEDNVVSILKHINPGVEIERHCRSIIKPYEIDLYLPQYKVGIECNPTCSHNSSLPFIEGQPTPYSYHKMKTDLAQESNIFLFHIFGYEWAHKQDIIESMLRNLLYANRCKIYARNCQVREISSRESLDFLCKNHRQGGTGAQVRLGLYCSNQLVSVMTFGRMRNAIGTSQLEDLTDCWELSRFCNVLNTTVIGGASKLFLHFIKTYNPSRIRSFSDRAHTRGTLYAKLGFKQIRMSDPGYVWVDSKTDVAYNRYNAQKQNIKKFLKDDTIDLSKTEKQIMEEHGFVQVFDSGTITWEWSK